MIRNIALISILIFVGAVNLFSQVKADFLISDYEGCGSLAVTFTDQSTTTSGSIVDWKWNLGGVISVKQNPGTIFTQPGEYNICLTVTTSTGATSSECKNNIIKVYPNPVAEFSVDKQEGCQPVEVHFKDLSTSSNGKITNWTWDIGGSSNLITTTDSLLNISTTYLTNGSYSSSLSIIDEKGCKNIITKPNLVKVVELPKVTLDYNILSSCDLPWKIQFTNLDPDSETKYSWDFGNGQTFVGSNLPLVTYTDAKKYTIKVFVEKGPCSDTIYFENLINTTRVTDFSIESTGICAGQNITLKDISSFVSDSIKWDFGDGSFSTSPNPSHLYDQPGCYVIKLTKYIGNCVQEIVKPCINVLPKPIVNFNIENGFSCLIPAPIKLKASADGIGNFEWHIVGTNLDSTMNGPTHAFELHSFGNYTVDLLFKNENGCEVAFNNNKFEISKFEADLPSYRQIGCIPYNAILQDSIESSVSISSWYWEIGNPVIFTSTDQNPIFPVVDTGRWDVKLIVQNINGCKDTIIKKDFIQGGIPPNVDFVADPLKACLNIPRNFTNQSSNWADNWLWTYGEGSFMSFDENPEYTFSDFGIFDITLTAYHNGCPNKKTIQQYITVYKPKSAFKVDYKCDDPYTIDIQNQSLGADSLFWVVQLSPMITDTIRDSLLSTYTFPDRGLYFLTHYSKSFESGCEHILTDSIFIVDLSANYVLDTIRGCAPLDVSITSEIIDAVSFEFLNGQFSISDPSNQSPIVTFNEGGTIMGPILVVTDRHGCRDTFQTSVPVEVSKIDAKILVPDVVCIPNSQQFLDGSLIGLAPIVDRRWDFTLNHQKDTIIDPTFDVPIEGNFLATLHLVDAWGCKDSITKEILGVTLIPAFSSDTLSCTQRGVRFKIDSDPTFLNAFEWSFGDGTTSFEKNPLHYFNSEGTFDICSEMFDSRGCSKKICKPQILTIINPMAAFEGDPISAPCPPLLSNFENQSKNSSKYSWSFGDDSGVSYNFEPSHVYTKPGSFDLVLMAEMIPGCVDTLVKKEYVNILGPTASISYELTGNCLPMDIKLWANSDKPYDYIWDYGDGKINSIPGQIISDTTFYKYENEGKFTPKLLVSDENGCSRTFIIDPVIANSISPNFTIEPNSFCGLPNTIRIKNETTSTADQLNYQWKLQGNNSYESTEVNPSWSVQEYGNFNIEMIVTATNCIDTLVQDSPLKITANPIADFVIQQTLACANVPLDISNISSIDNGKIKEYKWNFGNGMTDTTKTPIITFTNPGNYEISLSVISENGCIDEMSHDITISPNTLITLPEDKTICIGDSVNILANINSTEAYQIEWLGNSGVSCNTCELVNVKPSKTTTYYIKTTVESGCINQDSIQVTVIPILGPQLHLTSDTIVCENGMANIKILNFDPSFHYQWDSHDQGLNCYENCNTVIAAPDQTTFYSVIVTNSFGCFKEDSILVTVEKSIPDFLLESKKICEGAITTLTITGGNNSIWQPNPLLSCTHCEATQVNNLLQSEYYYVTVTSDAGCQYIDSIYVETISKTSINAGDDQLICQGETVILEGKGEGDILWSSKAHLTNNTSLKTSSTPNQTTDYYLTTTNGECVLKDTVLVNVIKKTEISALGDTICPSLTAMVTASGNADKYQWLSESKIIGSEDTLYFEPKMSMNLMVIGSKGLCLPDSAKIHVEVHPEIEFKLLKNQFEVFVNSKEKIEAQYDENQLYQFQWSPSIGLNCTQCPEPIVQNIETSTQYHLLVTDTYGCELEERILVKFTNECSRNGFYIPNIFTPYQRDGINDVFRIYAEDEAEFISISIYDRWGEQVFVSTDINQTWDGMFKNSELTQGVFTYIVTAKCDSTNENFNFVGDVTIIN